MSVPDVGEAIGRLRLQSTRLNSLTDAANELVQQVEEFLNSQCSVGSPAYVVVQMHDPEHDGQAGTFLGYRRVGPRFRIAVIETDDNDKDTSVKAWSDCPRTSKLDTVKQLPALLMKIADQVEADAQAAEKSVRDVMKALTALRAPAETQSSPPGGPAGAPRPVPRPKRPGGPPQVAGPGDADIPF